MTKTYYVPWSKRGYVFESERDYIFLSLIIGAVAAVCILLATLGALFGVSMGGWYMLLLIPAAAVIGALSYWVRKRIIGYGLILAFLSYMASGLLFTTGMQNPFVYALLVLSPQLVLICFAPKIPVLKNGMQVTIDKPSVHSPSAPTAVARGHDPLRPH